MPTKEFHVLPENADMFVSCIEAKKMKVFKFPSEGFYRFELRAESKMIKDFEWRWNQRLFQSEYKLKTQQNVENKNEYKYRKRNRRNG